MNLISIKSTRVLLFYHILGTYSSEFTTLHWAGEHGNVQRTSFDRCEWTRQTHVVTQCSLGRCHGTRGWLPLLGGDILRFSEWAEGNCSSNHLLQDRVTGGGTLAYSRLQGLQQVVKLSPICQDKRVRQSQELRGETISVFRRSQAKARRLCPPKQFLNGKNGTTITDPKDIANEHAAVFTDNSSSAQYSATFQAIKEQEEKVKIDFTSDNTEVCNKPFRLRDLRRSIMKAKPRAPGPDGIHNNLLKDLPEDTLKILKEILNKIWISADFPQQWRAATVIPIPKPNKDHTDPLSYRPIALTSCLCKVLERMINTRLIWYLEKYRILNRSQCGFRKHRSTADHLVSLERYLRDAFAQKQHAVRLFFDLEKAYETTWQYGIIRDLHRIGLRGRLPVFVSEYLRGRRIRVRIGTTLSDEFYPEEGVPTGGVLAVTCFGLKINELPTCIAKDIFKALWEMSTIQIWNHWSTPTFRSWFKPSGM